MSNAASEAGYMSAPDYTQYLFQKILLAPIGASIHVANFSMGQKMAKIFSSLDLARLVATRISNIFVDYVPRVGSLGLTWPASENILLRQKKFSTEPLRHDDDVEQLITSLTVSLAARGAGVLTPRKLNRRTYTNRVDKVGFPQPPELSHESS